MPIPFFCNRRESYDVLCPTVPCVPDRFVWEIAKIIILIPLELPWGQLQSMSSPFQGMDTVSFRSQSNLLRTTAPNLHNAHYPQTIRCLAAR